MLDERQSCNQEEVNYTSLLQTYAYDASQKGFRKLSIITVGLDVVVIALRYLFFTLFQWTLGRIWSWSTSKIYSDTWNYLLFRWRIWWINTILVCIDTVLQFSVRGRQTAWQVLESYCEATETLVRCVVLFIKIKNICKLYTFFFIRNLLKLDKLQDYAKQWHRSKIF